MYSAIFFLRLQENIVTSINKVFATTFKVLKKMLAKIKLQQAIQR